MNATMTTPPIGSPTPATVAGPPAQAGNPRNKVQEIAQTFNRLYSLPHYRLYREALFRNYRYAVGEMLSEKVLKQLEEEQRPALMFQLLSRDLNFISGVIKKDRKKMKAYPIRLGDEDLAEIHTILMDWAMDQCDGYDAIAKASLDAAIAKIGWINSFYSYRQYEKGRLLVQPKDPFSMLWDFDAKMIDQSDWRYLCTQGMYTSNEIISLYKQYMSPDQIDAIKENSMKMEGQYRTDYDGLPLGYYERIGLFEQFRADFNINAMDVTHELVNNFADARFGTYRVIEWHDRRMIEQQTVYSPTYGTSETVPQELLSPGKERDYNDFLSAAKQRHDHGKVKSRDMETYWIAVACPALLSQSLILERPYTVQNKGYQYKPIFWYDFHYDLSKTTCILDALISPNDLYNQMGMTGLQLLRKFSNPDTWYENGALSPEGIEQMKSKVVGKLVKVDNIAGVSDHPPNPNTFQMAEVMQKAAAEIMDRIGQYTPNLGGRAETSNEPASLYAQRVEQGMVMLSHPFSNIYKTMRNVFNFCDVTLQKFMPFETMIRLLEEPPEGLQGVQQSGANYWLTLNMETMKGVKNDITQGEYDFRVDIATPGQTEKQLNNMLLLDLAEKMAAAGQPTEILWYLILKNSGIPEAKEAAEFLKQQIEAKMQQEEFAQQLQSAQAKFALLAGARHAMTPQPGQPARPGQQQPQPPQQQAAV